MADHFPQEIWDHELMANQEPAVDWHWRGLLAGGHLALLLAAVVGVMWLVGVRMLLGCRP